MTLETTCFLGKGLKGSISTSWNGLSRREQVSGGGSIHYQLLFRGAKMSFHFAKMQLSLFLVPETLLGPTPGAWHPFAKLEWNLTFQLRTGWQETGISDSDLGCIDVEFHPYPVELADRTLELFNCSYSVSHAVYILWWEVLCTKTCPPPKAGMFLPSSAEDGQLFHQTLKKTVTVF